MDPGGRRDPDRPAYPWEVPCEGYSRAAAGALRSGNGAGTRARAGTAPPAARDGSRMASRRSLRTWPRSLTRTFSSTDSTRGSPTSSELPPRSFVAAWLTTRCGSPIRRSSSSWPPFRARSPAGRATAMWMICAGSSIRSDSCRAGESIGGTWAGDADLVVACAAVPQQTAWAGPSTRRSGTRWRCQRGRALRNAGGSA